MRVKTQTLAIAVCFALALSQLISCKKENATARVSDENNSNSTASLKANLVAWYKFTNGNTADYSGNNNHLVPHNVTMDTDYMGRPNNAYSFNGHNSYMQAPNTISLNPSSEITLVALFKSTAYYTGPNGISRILMKGKDDQSNGAYFLGYYSNGQLYGTYGDNQYQNNGASSPENSLQLNNWYKLVYTYKGGIGKLYINDTLVGQTNQVATFTPNTFPLRIGKTGRKDFPYYFIGIIDEIRIYNKALNQSQIIKVDSQLGE